MPEKISKIFKVQFRFQISKFFPKFQNLSKITPKLAKHYIFAVFEITKKFPNNYTKITNSMPIALRTGAIRIAFLILV